MSELDPIGRRFRATVQYDGARFHGSQLQPDLRTVQGELEAALERLSGGATRVHLAGRTDAGVHAAGQEIGFDFPPTWDADDLRRALNAVTPADLWVEHLTVALPGFHPRFDATGRRYEYRLAIGPDAVSPLRGPRAWAVDRPIDESLLRELSSAWVGERSFAGFAKAGQADRGTRCRVERVEWRGSGGELAVEIVADRFLHHMVRYLVGTSVQAACGSRRAADVAALLGGGRASRPPYPAPPAGLYLTGVRYPEGWNRAAGVPGQTPLFDTGGS